MALNQQHVQAFSPDGKLFTLINEQGVLRIWDTETNELKQEFTPNLHLSGPCTALIWVSAETVGSTQQSKKSRKSTEQENVAVETLYIVLGTSNGKVSLYSYAQGNIDRHLKGEGHAGKITAMVRDAADNLYTCGQDCQIIAWSLSLGRRVAAWNIGNDKPSSLAYLKQSESLVVGTRQLSVYSTTTREVVQTFTGHTSEIDHICSIELNNVEYIITSSRMERVISLWKIGKKGRNKAAVGTFLMEDIAFCLSCMEDVESGELRLASVTRSGVIHMYLADVDSLKTDKPIKPKLTISIASDSTNVVEPISALAASLDHAHNANGILIGYGDRRILVFEQLIPNFVEKLQVLIRTEPKKLYGPKHGNKNVEEVALKTLTPLVKDEEVDYKSALVLPKKKLKNSELPMEMRLENLNLAEDSTETTGPKAQSKVQLLIQALHSQDKVLLRSVLLTNDVKTIELTLQRLPVQYVSVLVNELTLLMQQKRVNVEYALKWLKILTITHSSQLLALGEDELLEKFGPCIGIIEHRANCLKELSKLSGRLNLLIGQLKRNIDDHNDELNTEDVLVYEDTDESSNSEIADEDDKGSDSNGEWEENEDDVEDDDMNDEYKMET